MSRFEDNVAKAEAYLARFRREGVLNHINGEAVAGGGRGTFVSLSPH